MNIFDFMYETFKFKKKVITLFESFAGVGSQAMALKDLSNEFGFELDVIGISEIDKNAIASYNAIHGETKNFGSITDIQEIPQVDIFTYSFPCQDISLAGNQKGFSKGSGTRSGLLWEVERILENQEKIGKLPQVLLMENVKALAGNQFVNDFNKWQLKLEDLGYKNYWQILNAKDYGIPQNRERVFMVSILGEYNYNFPKPFELKLRLKDMLEDEVDDKYYLSAKQLKQINAWNSQQNPIDNAAFRDTNYLQTITAKSNTSMNASMLLLKEKTKLVEYDGVYLEQLSRGIINKEKDNNVSTTLKAQTGHNCVIVKGNYSPSGHNASRIVDENGLAPTVMENHGTVTATQQNISIRKLTPKECWRLMGFSDDDFNKAEQVCSNTQLYKQAGNSIVKDVLYYIFKQLFKGGNI